MVSSLELQYFIDNGFLVFNELLKDQDCLKVASELIEKTLNTTKLPTSRSDSKEWVNAKSRIQAKSELMNLIRDKKVTNILTKLLCDYDKLKSCQIASRFPGENCDTPYNNINNTNNTDNNNENKDTYDYDRRWHIDNYTPKDLRRTDKKTGKVKIPHDFSCLVGIYVSDNTKEFEGNFTVFPGSHHRIQAYSILNGGKKYYEQNGLEDIRHKLKLSNPFQVTAKKGSVIFVHRHLAHLISAPNNSDTIRTIIWFRVRSTNNSDVSFTNIWNDYRGLTSNLDSGVNGQIAKHNHNHNHRGSLWNHDELIEIEYKGYGYFVKTFNKNDDKTKDDIKDDIKDKIKDDVKNDIRNDIRDDIRDDANTIVLRIKQNGKNYFPCMFASFITLTVTQYQDKKTITVHTNGFINRNRHHFIANELHNKTLLEMAEWIYNCDYCKLIESWVPMLEQLEQLEQNDKKTSDKKTNDKKTNDITQRVMKLHHLHSKSKTAMMMKWGKELKVSGGILKGAPGLVIVEGSSEMVDTFMNRFLCFHWRHYKEDMTRYVIGQNDFVIYDKEPLLRDTIIS
jgi:hypothetical protein